MAVNNSTSLDLTDEGIWKQRGLNVPLLSSDRANWEGMKFDYHRQPSHQILFIVKTREGQ